MPAAFPTIDLIHTVALVIIAVVAIVWSSWPPLDPPAFS